MQIEDKHSHALLFDMKCDSLAFTMMMTTWFNGNPVFDDGPQCLSEFLQFLDNHDLGIRRKGE